MITAVIIAWVIIVVLLLALPVLAWWLGARDVWSRPSKRTEPDLYREMVRRHDLRPAEQAQVESALTWGRELQEAKLRAAVVDWGETLQRLAAQRRGQHPQVRRIARLVLLIWLAFAVAVLAFAVARGDWGRILSIAVWPLVWAWPASRLAGAMSRAIRLNSGTPAP
jgi:hypothetical protein